MFALFPVLTPWPFRFPLPLIVLSPLTIHAKGPTGRVGWLTKFLGGCTFLSLILCIVSLCSVILIVNPTLVRRCRKVSNFLDARLFPYNMASIPAQTWHTSTSLSPHPHTTDSISSAFQTLNHTQPHSYYLVQASQILSFSITNLFCKVHILDL